MPALGLPLIAALLAPGPGAAGDTGCIDEPVPFRATYDLLRNDELLGTSVMTLERGPRDTWVYTIKSQAEHGLAGFFGVNYVEESHWTLRKQKILPLHYQRSEEIAFNDEDYSIRFNWDAGAAHGVADGDDWTVKRLPAGTVDRFLVNLKLVADLSCSVETLNYRVLEEGELEWWRFERVGFETIEVPMGTFQAIKVAKEHSSPDRETLTWFVPELDWVAARIEHVEDAGEERYTMVLRDYRVAGSAR